MLFALEALHFVQNTSTAFYPEPHLIQSYHLANCHADHIITTFFSLANLKGASRLARLGRFWAPRRLGQPSYLSRWFRAGCAGDLTGGAGDNCRDASLPPRAPRRALVRSRWGRVEGGRT